MSLEFESTDKQFVSFQIEKWIGEVAGTASQKENVLRKTSKSSKTTKTKPLKRIISEKDIEVITETPELPPETVEELEKQVASAIKATQNIIKDSNDIKLAIKEPDFETFAPEISQMANQTASALTDDTEENQEEESSPFDVGEKAQNNKFYKILQEKFASLPEMVQNNIPKNLEKEKKDEDSSATIAELIDLKNPQTPLDYLIITAYYLKECDLLDRYSLKQINSKIIKFIEKPLNHAIIQEAVSNDFLEVVPDYTGMANVTEYIITSEGINYLINEL
jgi:hypothetical protein